MRQVSLLLTAYVGDHHRFPLYSTTPQERASFPDEASYWLSTIAPEDVRIVTLNDSTDSTPKSIVLCPAVKKLTTSNSDDNVAYVTGFYGYNAFGCRGPGFTSSLGLAFKSITSNPSTGDVIERVTPDDIISPAEMIAFGDGVVGWDRNYDDTNLLFEKNVKCLGTPDSSSRVRRRHGGRLNAAFVDGHISAYTLRDLFSSANSSVASMWNRDHQPH